MVTVNSTGSTYLRSKHQTTVTNLTDEIAVEHDTETGEYTNGIFKFQAGTNRASSAILNVYVSSLYTGGQLRFIDITGNWNESSVTWSSLNKAPLGLLSRTRNFTASDWGRKIQVDITDVYNAHLNDNFGILIEPVTTGAEIYFSSSRNTSPIAAPHIEVEETAAAPPPPPPPPANEGILKGRITDSSNSYSLLGATVTANYNSVASGAGGLYSISFSTNFSGMVTYSKSGYITQQMMKAINLNETITQDIALVPEAPTPPPPTTHWWEQIIYFDSEGMLHIGPEIKLVSELQGWLENNVYGPDASTLAKTIFYTALAAISAATLWKIISPLSKSTLLTMGEQAETFISDPGAWLLQRAQQRVMDQAISDPTKWQKLVTALQTIPQAKTVLYGLGAILGADGLMTWLASDNIVSGSSFNVSGLPTDVRYGVITRDKALEQLEKSRAFMNYGSAFLQTSTILNPFLWLFRKITLTNIEVAKQKFDEVEDQIRNIQIEGGGTTPPPEPPGPTVPSQEVVIPMESGGSAWNSWKITIKATEKTTGSPLAAWVIINDVFKGIATPASFYLAPSSSYNIKLRLKGYKQGEQTFTTAALPA